MKKPILVLVILSLIVINTGFAFADCEGGISNEEYESEESTRYSYFSGVSTTFYISNGISRWTLRANKSNPYDSAIVTTVLYKKNTGAIVTYSNTFYNSNINISRSRTLESQGTYYVKFTIKCYKNGELKETITLNTVSDTY